jgi:hypothetical protein
MFHKLKTVYNFYNFIDYIYSKQKEAFIDKNEISLETKGLTLHIVLLPPMEKIIRLMVYRKAGTCSCS